MTSRKYSRNSGAVGLVNSSYTDWGLSVNAFYTNKPIGILNPNDFEEFKNMFFCSNGEFSFYTFAMWATFDQPTANQGANGKWATEYLEPCINSICDPIWQNETEVAFWLLS